jgi:hypothetical protein
VARVAARGDAFSGSATTDPPSAILARLYRLLAEEVMRSRTAIATFALLMIACGARTDLPEGADELDSSLPQDAQGQDVSASDATTEDAPADAKPDVEDASVQDAPFEDAPVQDAGADVDDAAPPPMCVPSCTHNHQCEVTCPSIPSGRWCCDEQVGICYAFAGHHCPNVIADAGFD